MHEAKRSIVGHRNNLTRFMMAGKLTASGVDLAAEKAARNRERLRGSGRGHPPPRRLGWPSRGF